MWPTTAPQAQKLLLRNQKQGCYNAGSAGTLLPSALHPSPSIEVTHDMSSESLLVLMDPVPVPRELEATSERWNSQQKAATFTSSMTVASCCCSSDVGVGTLVTYEAATLTPTRAETPTSVSQSGGSPLPYPPDNAAYMFGQSAPTFVKASEGAVGTDVRLSVVNQLFEQLQPRYPSQAGQRISTVDSPKQAKDVRKRAVSRLLAQMVSELSLCDSSFVSLGGIHRGSSSSGISVGESSTCSQSVGAAPTSTPTMLNSSSSSSNGGSSAAAAAAEQRTRGVAYCIGTKCVHADFWKRLRAKKGIAHYVCQYCNKKWRTISSKIWNPQTGFTEEGAKLYNIPLSAINPGQANQLSAWQDLLRYTSEKCPAAQSRASLRPRPGPAACLGGAGVVTTMLHPTAAATLATPGGLILPPRTRTLGSCSCSNM